MISNTLRDADLRHVLHPYTNLVAHEKKGPFVIVRGEGVRVFDEAGKEYIEGMSGLWCASLGFTQPRLRDAAMRQMDTLPFFHQFASKSHPPGIRLAERLVAMAPVPMARVFFANSGSEANDTVVKIVRYINHVMGRPHKKKIISRHRAYHGVTLASASLTGLPANHRAFDLPMPGVLHVTCPHFYREASPDEDEGRFVERLAMELEQMIQSEGPDTIAAFFAEPVMGAGGVVIPPAGYFPRIQAILDKYDILLVADEVICGFGRTGNPWGSQTFDLKPDIITSAKALSAAWMPIAAVMVSQKVWEPLQRGAGEIGTFGHGFTYSGHPVAAAVALEALDIYEQDGIFERVGSLSGRFLAHLHAFSDHPLIGHVRGVGLIGALELAADKETRTPFDPARAMAASLVDACQEEGLILRALAGDIVAFCPPLVISPDDLDVMFERFRRALERWTLQIHPSPF
ncbi:aminotransferase class III-fold pyridoxal phosphate-dependent enzyme [Haematospirillum sp. 15-248]|uniref:aminotransferase n=1 Tax=Haematospirillum sp. 15-248 TaxID=2723107 RepID=UPI001438E2DC|nr:aminotransferase [Haematospirillum sp. 15-248]NKD88596.1 aminotransferase class III-fold pyridoxal phosphate-dependent enzyme [Haematospirillum sp. 15-248]